MQASSNPESKSRLLLLIDGFTSARSGLEGRTKLAKLDFFLRYPKFLKRALAERHPNLTFDLGEEEEDNFETRMIRYRYGPWDPAYFALIGSLIGKGLVQPVPGRNGSELRTTEIGRRLASAIAAEPEWTPIADRVAILKKHFNQTGNSLKNFIYGHFPEVTKATWGDRL